MDLFIYVLLGFVELAIIVMILFATLSMCFYLTNYKQKNKFSKKNEETNIMSKDILMVENITKYINVSLDNLEQNNDLLRLKNEIELFKERVYCTIFENKYKNGIITKNKDKINKMIKKYKKISINLVNLDLKENIDINKIIKKINKD